MDVEKKIEEKIKRIEDKEKRKKQPLKKKALRWLLIFLILLLGVAVGLGIVFREKLTVWLKPKKETPSLLGEKEERPKFEFSWKLWEDPAGFSFEYPQDLEIDVHPEDETNYSFLTLTAKDKKGKIEIICNDSQYKDVKEWVSEDSLVKQGSNLETKVASIVAQKVALGNGREITALIDWDEVIYIIDKIPEDELDYWSAVYSHILDSFKLTPLEGESEEEFVDWLQGFENAAAGVDVVEQVEVIE